jgi:hypothetical protein
VENKRLTYWLGLPEHHSLNNDMPDKVVSDRANVSQRVIEQHYDRRTERENMEQRRAYLDDL